MFYCYALLKSDNSYLAGWWEHRKKRCYLPTTLYNNGGHPVRRLCENFQSRKLLLLEQNLKVGRKLSSVIECRSRSDHRLLLTWNKFFSLLLLLHFFFFFFLLNFERIFALKLAECTQGILVKITNVTSLHFEWNSRLSDVLEFWLNRTQSVVSFPIRLKQLSEFHSYILSDASAFMAFDVGLDVNS